MARHCMRPGCDRPVAASLTYDTESVSVWLDRAEAGGEMAQQVCAAHAANLTVPLGWTVTDRRLAPVGSAGPLAPEPEPPTGDAGTGDARTEDARTGDARTGDARTGDARTGDARTEDARTEDARTEDAATEVAGTADGPGPSSGTGVPEDGVPEAGVPEAEAQPADGGRPGEAAARVPEAEAPRPARRKPKGLLDRAFEWTGPQHSVLTTGSPAGADDGDRPDE